MLTECQLRSMRRAVATTFDKTALILTVARIANGRGGHSEDWDAATSISVACNVMKASSPGDQVEGQKQASDQRRTINLPWGTVVTTANRIQIGDTVYEVLGVLDDQTYPVSTEVAVKKLA